MSITTQSEIIAFDSRTDYRRHVVFGHSSACGAATYCGYYFTQSRTAHRKQKRCKKCTKELRAAGMSWRWYETTKHLARREDLNIVIV